MTNIALALRATRKFNAQALEDAAAALLDKTEGGMKDKLTAVVSGFGRFDLAAKVFEFGHAGYCHAAPVWAVGMKPKFKVVCTALWSCSID